MIGTKRIAPALVAVIAFACTSVAGPPTANSAQLRQVTERVFPFEEGGHLSIENQNGRITVEAWNRPEVRIQITRVVRSGDDERVAALMKELRADIGLGHGKIEVVSRYPKRAESFGVWDVLGQRVTALNIHYYVQVPTRTRLVLETSNGELRVRGTAGRLVGQTVNGNVEVTSVSGPVDVNTTNGNIRLMGLAGSAHAGTTNGGIEAELKRVEATGTVELATTNGDVAVALPVDLKATLDAVTTNGKITASYAVEPTGVTTSKKVQGKIRGGGTAVTLRTTNGNILLRKVGETRRD